jgi:RNA polymerase sigma-B factor
MELVRMARPTSRDFRRAETHRLFAELEAATGEAEREALVEELIVLNTQVAYAIARRFQNRGVPLDDLEQVACLALVRTVRKFDRQASEDFLTYAVPSITGEIKRYFRDHGWAVRPTRRLQELQARIRGLTDDGHTSHTPQHLAAVLDVGVDEVTEALRLDGCFTPTSLDQVMRSDDGSGTTTIGDTLTADGDDHERAEVRLLLNDALTHLTERQVEILRMRFVEDLTQQQIGDRLGVTQMQVSRLLASILRRLRTELGPEARVTATGG